MNYDGDPHSRSGQIGLWMRIAGLLFPVLFILQGIMVSLGHLPQDRYISHFVFIVISLLFLATSVISVLLPISFRPGIYIRTFVLQLFGLVLISITTGFVTPLTIIVALMLYDSYRLLSIPGLTVSSLMLFAAVGIDIYRGIQMGSNDLTSILIMIISVILFMIIILMVLSTQMVRQSALESSRRQEELQRFRLATLMNNLRDGIISTDEDGMIRIYNAAALNILDTNDSLNGRFINDILQLKDQRGRRVNLYNKLKKSRHLQTDELYFNYEDETIRLDITATELLSGKASSEKLDIDGGFIIIIRDVTLQKNLDDERDEFISVVSHELRTPLAIAEGTLDNIELMLQQKNVGHDKLIDSLGTAHEQILFLSRMVNDLSTLSRAERGVADEPELIDVKDMLEAMYREYLPSAEDAGLRLDLNLEPQLGNINVSRLYMNELLQNLITNAIKYTKKGSVTISATKNKDKITFSIKDTGIGIGKNEQQKIFEKFYRSEDYRTRETRGTGLGLYVAIKLARKLNTSFDVKSRLNVGSEFSFAIDRHKK